MRIPSGVTDQYIYFVAVDATDFKTRETGLSSFTVYRSRNGGVAAAYTAPTINETSSANMPGVYELLLDEDMTIDSGDHEQEVCLHITATGMAPVTRIFTIYRPDVTAGQTLTVSSGTGNAAVQSMAANTLTASALATDAVTEIQTGLATSAALAVVDGIVDDILVDTGTDIPATLTTINGKADAILVDTGTDIPATLTTISGKVDTVDTVVDSIQVDTDSIETKVDAILVDTGTTLDGKLVTLQTSVDDIPTNAELTTALGTLNDLSEVDIRTAVGLSSANLDTQLSGIDSDIAAIDIPTVGEIADAVWDEDLVGHTTVGTAGDTLSDAGAGGTPPTADAIADEVATRTLNANITKVNNINVTGQGTSNDPWGPTS